MPKKTLTIHIDADTIDQFKNYCRLNALKLSGKVELLLKKEMENAKNNPTLVELFKEMVSQNKSHKEIMQHEQKKIKNPPVPEKQTPPTSIPDRPAQVRTFEEIIKDAKKTPTLDQLRSRKGV